MNPEHQPVPKETVEYDPNDQKPVLANIKADPEIEKAIQAGTQVVFEPKKQRV